MRAAVAVTLLLVVALVATVAWFWPQYVQFKAAEAAADRELARHLSDEKKDIAEYQAIGQGAGGIGSAIGGIANAVGRIFS